MNMATELAHGKRTYKPEGPFVLITFDGDYLFDDRHELVKMNGKPKMKDIKRLYFEEDLGPEKAKYFTEDIEKAKCFETLDAATAQLCKLHNPHLIKVRQLAGGAPS